MKSSSPPRTPSQLSDSVHRQLNSYALAAGAAGMGVLALIPSSECVLPVGVALVGLLAFSEAEAKVVYTPANMAITCKNTSNGECRGTLKLDLNHDNRVDFQFNVHTSAGDSGQLSITALHRRNGVEGPLSYGALIGPQGNFQQGEGMCSWNRVASTISSNGPWCNLPNGYLGFKFIAHGQIHYGWARLSVRLSSGTLTDYAYETFPNKPIVAGKTQSSDEATLGRLAQGASGVAAWRQKH